MIRPRRDLDDLDDNLFDREEAAARRSQREEERALAVERGKQLDEQDRIYRERVKAAFVGTTEAMILAEYRHAGVEPRPGTLVSLATLRSIGWRIEEFAGEKMLIAPPAPPKYEPKGECS